MPRPRSKPSYLVLDADDTVCYKRVEELLFSFSLLGHVACLYFFMVYLSLGFGLVIGNGRDNGSAKAKKNKRRLVSFDDVLLDL